MLAKSIQWFSFEGQFVFHIDTGDTQGMLLLLYNDIQKSKQTITVN